MSDEFGGDMITILDDEGNEHELEVVDTVEVGDSTYTIFLPPDIDTMDTEDPDYGFIILRNVEENGELLFESIDDDEERERIYDLYMEQLDAEEEDWEDDE